MGSRWQYWRAHADRDALSVKVEAIVLARNAAEMAVLESQAEATFDTLYDLHKKAIYKLKEQRRVNYEKLRLATGQDRTRCPGNCRRPSTSSASPTDSLWERHLYR